MDPMPPHPDGPESFCYDAVEARAFVWDGYSQLAVLRSLEVEYSYFDGNPAVAATCVVGAHSLEAFLTGGAWPSVPDDVQARVREYLVTKRTPGQSTWVSVDFASLLAGSPATTDRRCPVWWGFEVETAPWPHPGFPGPSYAGSFDEQPGGGGCGSRRLLVTPGQHTVVAHVSVRYRDEAGTSVRIETLRAGVNVVVAPGQHVALRCTLDLQAGSAALAPALSRGA